MKEDEVIYIMYNHPKCTVPTTLLLTGNEHGKENWNRRNNRQDQRCLNTLLFGLIKTN